MHLLSALAAGIQGAGGGTCVIYKRGTSTKATYYDDFEGTTARSQSASTELSLDSNGRLEAYVDEVVDVAVKDSSGNAVITFTDGASSPAVEVRSASFTGVDYVTAASAAGNPTSLQTALNLWKTNAGSADFKIQGVTPTQLYNQTYTQCENVKRHGAEGDNSTDDSSAIAAAITALGANGGVVYFPPGTYRVTTTLTVPQNVSLIGTGPDSSAITMDHASNDLVNSSGTSTYYYNEIRGLRLTASQANSGTPVELATAVRTRISNCHIGGSNNNGHLLHGSVANTELVCEDTHFVAGAAAASCILMPQATSKSHISRCWFELATSHSAVVVNVNDATVTGCVFNPTEASVSSLTYLQYTGNVWVMFNHFLDPGVGTATPIFQNTMASADELHEFGNNFDGNSAPLNYTATAGGRMVFGSRDTNHQEVTDNSAAVTLNADGFGVIVLQRTVDSAQVISANKAPPGSRLTLFIYWNVGTTVNAPTFSTDFRTVGAVAPANGEADVREFVSEDFGGTLKWTQVNTRISVTV